MVFFLNEHRNSSSYYIGFHYNDSLTQTDMSEHSGYNENGVMILRIADLTHYITSLNRVV